MLLGKASTALPQWPTVIYILCRSLKFSARDRRRSRCNCTVPQIVRQLLANKCTATVIT